MKIDVSKLPIAEVDELLRQATMSDEERARDWQERKAAAAFCRKHPEFKPSAEAGTLLENYIHAMGWSTTSIESIERAYKNLKAEGSLR
jgi:hypothetical protein